MTTRSLPPRPLGVVLLALFQVLQGFWYLILTLIFLALSSVTSDEGNKALSGILFLLGLAYLVLGVYVLLLARGYVKGYEWARRRGISIATFAIVLVIVEIFIVKLQVFLPDSPFWTILGNIVIIWYLGREKTKRFFASRSPRSPAQH